MPQEGPDARGFCVPVCVWFKCGKRALQMREKNLWCQWLNEPCAGPSCSYSICVRGKMLSQNKCGLIVKRVTVDKVKPDDFKVDVKISGKLAKRLGDDKDMI